ncbi:MAG: methionyl-tRNA formyltransferase [Lachnospiraceae bacterium]|nr:methionyl-tRNA formyltransferase [Lachnospiraceae bacterium]
MKTESDNLKKIVFMGTPDFASHILERLLSSEYIVQAVFTQPDRPKGRSGKLQMSPVKEVAAAAGIPVYQPLKIREGENYTILSELAPDVIVVAAFGQIIPRQILDLPKYGCINVHASLLPAYRGAAPIQWAILNGESVTGVTTMQMGTGLDTGDMIEKIEVPIAADETGGSLFDKLKEAGADVLMSTLAALNDGTAVRTPQPEESPTAYASMLTHKTGEIDWTAPAAVIERKVRGLNPWPSAYTYLNGRQLKIWRSAVLDGKAPSGADAGTIVRASGAELWIQTGDGILAVQELQLEGKKRLETDAFLRGCHPEEGMLLGQ